MFVLKALVDLAPVRLTFPQATAPIVSLNISALIVVHALLAKMEALVYKE